MKYFKLTVFIGLGLITIQSCTKQPQECECLDMLTEMMKGESEVNYDESFRKEHRKKHKDQETECDQFFDAAEKNGSEEKIFAKMKECNGYEEYSNELDKQTEHYEKQMKKQLEESFQKMD